MCAAVDIDNFSDTPVSVPVSGCMCGVCICVCVQVGVCMCVCVCVCEWLGTSMPALSVCVCIFAWMSQVKICDLISPSLLVFLQRDILATVS